LDQPISIFKPAFRNLLINPISQLLIQINQNTPLIALQFGAHQQQVAFLYEPVVKLPSSIQTTATAFLSHLFVDGRPFRALVQLDLNWALDVFAEPPSLVLSKPFNCHFTSKPNSTFKPNKPCFSRFWYLFDSLFSMLLLVCRITAYVYEYSRFDILSLDLFGLLKPRALRCHISIFHNEDH